MGHMKTFASNACPLIWLFVLSSGNRAYIRHNAVTNQNQSRANDFFFVQLADPQLGMQNLAKPQKEVALTFKNEEDMLKKAVKQILKLDPKPAFVVMSGDMQNWWPRDYKDSNKVLQKTPEAGDKQAAAVQEQMQKLIKAGIPVHYLPGNHDLDDAPTEDTMERYKKMYGDWTGDFKQDNVEFVYLNSQLYYDVSNLKTSRKTFNLAYDGTGKTVNVKKKFKSAKQVQDTFLTNKLSAIGKSKQSVKAVVFLTHIPPFIGNGKEAHGWANWIKKDRDRVMKLAAKHLGKKKIPMVWFCGHFHANVRTIDDTTYKVPIEVVTSGSVGSAMLWQGEQSNKHKPVDATKIAGAKDGSASFFNYIMDGSANKFDLIPKRIKPDPSYSGLRVVRFFQTGDKVYDHKWFTLNDFEKVIKIDDKTMSGSYTRAK
jgi:3',5'-cyclic AMP phosphodiesterase CpdA